MVTQELAKFLHNLESVILMVSLFCDTELSPMSPRLWQRSDGEVLKKPLLTGYTVVLTFFIM